MKPFLWLRENCIGLFLVASITALLGVALYILAPVKIIDPTRTPWDSVPSAFFVLIFASLVGLFGLMALGKLTRSILLPLSFVLLLFSGVAAWTYTVGFGFDPFIHQATEKIILETGTISPKPPYYIGQYALVVLFARVTGASVVGIDRFFVPLALLLILPCAYWALRRAFAWTAGEAAGAAVALTLLPLSSFIMTTPQGLANALVFITAWLALPTAAGQTKLPNIFLVLLTAVTLLIHPLSGILLAGFLGLVLLSTSKKTADKKWLIIAITLFTSVALPAMFLFNGIMSAANVSLDASLLKSPGRIVEKLTGPEIVNRRFDAVLDIVYFWRTVRTFALAALAGVGLWLLRRQGKITLAYALAGIIFIANYVLLRTLVDFNFLIDYERANYADRIPDLALLLLSPLIVYALVRLFARLAALRRPTLAVGLVVLSAAFSASGLYLSYPRRDAYETSAGWSTGQADINAVRQIQADANGRAYVVLANQSVAAAAIREYGFARYFDSTDPAYSGPVFYYPVPTGGPLYTVFLEMNRTHGTAASAAKAMDLAGVDTAYFVVNHYWADARAIITQAKKEASAAWTVDAKDFVFRYDR